MIGHYLLTLTEEQENRVLVTAIRSGWYGAPCLVGAALGPDQAESQFDLLKGQVRGLLRGWLPCRQTDGFWPVDSTVELRFDGLCGRFGIMRVTAAIRNRILSNRARRTLSGYTLARNGVGVDTDQGTSA